MAPVTLPTSNDHEDLRKAVKELCANFDLQYWEACDANHRFPTEFFRAFTEAGWLSMMVPEHLGGGGAGLSEMCAVLEEVAASGGAINACSAVHVSIVSVSAVLRHGDAEMQKRYLPGLIDGSLYMSFGVTEPDAGTDTTRIKTSASKTGTGYLVDGMKTWHSGGQEATNALLLVRTSPYDAQHKARGLTLLIVDMTSPGITLRPIRKIGRNAVDSNDAFFDAVPVSLADRLGEEGRGFSYLLDGLNAERIMLAAEAIGVGRWALSAATEYANTRTVFDRPIGRNQAVQHPLARAYIELTGAAALVQAGARGFDACAAGAELGILANSAKYAASEAAFRTTDDAMQIFGGYSFAREFHIGRHWIESRLQRIAPVNNQMILNYIAERVLFLPRSY